MVALCVTDCIVGFAFIVITASLLVTEPQVFVAEYLYVPSSLSWALEILTLGVLLPIETLFLVQE